MENNHLPDVSVFLASSAHDMKNSLNILSGMTERMLGELSPESFAGYKDLSCMLYEIKRVNQGIIQLLALYKIDQHLYPFDPQQVLLTDFLDELTAQNAPLLASQTIELVSECPSNLLWHFDRDLIGGVVSQALNNAMRYSHGHIRLVISSTDQHLEIRVEDDGTGYPDDMLKEAPNQLGIDFNTGSTGLGLYFARIVAQMHKNQGRTGSLRLENGGAWGGGCFVLQLP